MNAPYGMNAAPVAIRPHAAGIQPSGGFVTGSPSTVLGAAPASPAAVRVLQPGSYSWPGHQPPSLQPPGSPAGRQPLLQHQQPVQRISSTPIATPIQQHRQIHQFQTPQAVWEDEATAQAELLPAAPLDWVAQEQSRLDAEGTANQDAEFLRLLDSLEVRVDLMAQMQQTRNQIQARHRSDAPLADEDSADQSPPAPSVVQPTEPPAGLGRAHSQILYDQLHKLQNYLQQAGGNSMTDVPALPPEREAAANHELVCTAKAVQAEATREERLAKENEELWAQLGEQSDCIRKLTGEVAFLQGHLKETLGETGELEVARLRDQLAEERCSREADAKAWAAEKERLLAELHDLRGRSGRSGRSAPTSPFSPGPGSTPGSGLDDTVALPTRAVLAAEAAAAEGLPASLLKSQAEGAFTAPFSHGSCGANVSLSEDGYVAARTRGCRQSVLLGSAPLQRQALGWYYELEVRETVEGWVGGLGMGVTKSSPQEIRRVPDKAWRMPSTYMIGYWGCVFLDGKERRTSWRPETLAAGTLVGVLVAGDGSGDLHVFVDKVPIVSIEGALRDVMEPGLELYPVVDVFAATLAVQLQPHAKIPDPPWAPGTLGSTSASGTPAASLVSAA